MRNCMLVLAVVGSASHACPGIGSAQQFPQRRPLTINYRYAPVTKTGWSSDSNGSTGSNSIGGATIGGDVPNALPGTSGNTASATGGTGYSSVQGGAAYGSNQARISNQQLQNPSGGFNFSHAGFSHNHYVSPNNYFGPQFHAWNNTGLQPVTFSGPDSFNRFQPATNSVSGAYFTPTASYLGGANNSWSNLSAGNVTPNFNGGWTYGR